MKKQPDRSEEKQITMQKLLDFMQTQNCGSMRNDCPAIGDEDTPEVIADAIVRIVDDGLSDIKTLLNEAAKLRRGQEMVYDIRQDESGEVYLLDLAHDRSDLRQVIRSEMDRQKIGSEKLAKLSGVNTRSVYRLLAGECITSDNMLKVIGTLGIRLKT